MPQNPSRQNPQTAKPNNEYTSLIKTLGLNARFYPDGVDKGRQHAMRVVQNLVPWHSEEMRDLRGEIFDSKMLGNMLSTKSLHKYNKENWEELSLGKQAECRLAWAILGNGRPLTKTEFDAMWLGMSVNLRGLKRTYKKSLQKV